MLSLGGLMVGSNELMPGEAQVTAPGQYTSLPDPRLTSGLPESETGWSRWLGGRHFLLLCNLQLLHSPILPLLH